MAYKHREELVGKRFLSVSCSGKLKLSKISDWEWRAGVIRAATHRNPKHSELAVLVEFDDVDWKRREWIRVYEENLFQVFAIESTLVWLPRKQPIGAKLLSTYWPGVNYKILVDNAGLSDSRQLPVEYLIHKDLAYVDYSDLKPHQVDLSDSNCLAVVHNHPEVAKAIGHWSQYQDGQRILLTTPSVLVGYRVEVYRAEGTTQWYTAVIVSYNENTKELTLTDDTVLEEHNEDPSLVQMRLIGDGVVESILRGENIGITPRRRSCTTAQHQQHLGHYTRTRSQLPNPVQCHRALQQSNSRKQRVRSGNEVLNSVDSDKEKGSSFVKDKKIKSSSSGDHENSPRNNCEVNKKSKASAKAENCCNKNSDLESENDIDANDSGFKTNCEQVVKANHHHRRRPKETNVKSNCNKSEEHSDVPNPCKESDNEERAGQTCEKLSKSYLKSRLKDKSIKDKSKCAVRSQNKNNVESASSCDSSVDGEREASSDSTQQRTKVKNCSVIVDAVEKQTGTRTSNSEVKLSPDVDSARSAAVDSPKDPPPSTSITCLSVESAVGGESSDNGANCDSQPSPPKLSSARQQQSSSPSIENQARQSVVEFSEIGCNVETDVVDQCSSSSSESDVVLSEYRRQKQSAQANVPVSSTGMSPVSYVKQEIENVTNGDQTRLSCTPTPSSSSSVVTCGEATEPYIADDCKPTNHPVEPTQGSMKSGGTNRNDCGSVIKVRKVEESGVNRGGESVFSSPSASAANSLVLDPNEPVRIWRDPKLVGLDNSVFHITSVQHSTMAHPAGARNHPYSGSTRGAANLQQQPQHSGRSSSGALQSHFPPHMSPVPHPSMSHVANSAAYLDHQQASMRLSSGAGAVVAPQPPPPQSSPSSQHPYPPHPSHVLAQHHLMSQYPPIHNMDLVWPKNYPPQVQPWMMHQYSDERDRAAAAILQERDIQARIIEKERQAEMERAKEKQERMERERREQEKLEKEKLERERIQKEREKLQELERIKKEKVEKELREKERERLEQERVRREVHQHFEESFRAAQYKQQMSGWNKVPRQAMVETGSSNTTSSHHYGDVARVSSRNSSVVHSSHSHPASSYPNNKPADLSKDSRLVVCGSGDPRYLTPEEQRREEEKWNLLKRQQENTSALVYNPIAVNSRNPEAQQRSSSAHSCYTGPDAGHNQNLRNKQEYVVNPSFSSAPKSSSVPMANNSGSSGNVKMEQTSASYNIYGYQPFLHTYIINERRGPMVATVPDNHKYNPAEMEPNRTTIPVTQSANVPPLPHHRSGRCSPPIQESERRRRSNHGSVIVCSENVRHDNSKIASPILSPKHQHTKMTHGQGSEVTNAVYDNPAAFKTFEASHGQASAQVSNEGHLGRMVSQIHQYGEPQNFHKSSVTHHEQHQQYISRQGLSRTNVHQPPTPSSNYSPNVISNVSPTSGKSAAAPINYGSDLVQQGLVPNPMYNHSSASGRSITHGASMHHNSASIPTSPSQKMSSNKSVTQSSNNLSLPARSSPGAIYGKASIVAGTPLSRPPSNIGQPPTALVPSNYSLHTPPPAHHNGSRSQPDHTRPASAHSQPPLPGPPPSHTAMSGQTSHSPIDRSLSSSRGGGVPPLPGISPSQSHMNSDVVYSNTIPAGINLNVNLPPPHVASPHVPSPVPMPPTGGYGGHSSQSSRASSIGANVMMPLPSPPQTQPLDLQAPDRHRESRSVSPGKRKSSKDVSQRKRPKTVANVAGVANEGLAAAVHQIISNNALMNNFNGPRLSVPFTSAASTVPTLPVSTTVSVTSVNTSGLDTLVKTALATSSVSAPTSQVNSNVQQPITPVTSPNKDSGFMNIYRTFVNSSQQNQTSSVANYATYPYGKHKGKHMAAKSNLAQVKLEEVNVTNSRVEITGKPVTVTSTSQSSATVSTSATNTITSISPPKSVYSNPVTTQSINVNGPSEQPEKAISPALSNASSTSTCGTSIPKLKKEWLIRHSNEDGKNIVKTEPSELPQAVATTAGSIPGNSSSSTNFATQEKDVPTEKDSGNNSSMPSTGARSVNVSATEVSVNGHVNVKTEPNEINSMDDSETESVSTTSTVKSASKRTTRSKKRKAPKKEVRQSKSRNIDHNESNQDEDKDMDVDDEPLIKRVTTPRKRGRKPKSKSTRADAVRKTKSAKSSSTKIKKPSIARLKRTGESFLQKGPCCEVAPKLSKCRECRMTQFQRSKKMPNIFCRFYEFRRLKYTKNGFLTIAGFSEPKDAGEDDLKLWLPPVDDPASDLKVDTSYFILTHVGDQFCDLVEQEREAQAMHMSEDKTVAWKRVVQGVREMCDVCETTLFNIHWACNKCGFVVCIDCYKARRNGTVKEEENPGKDRDSYSWLMCNSKQMHEQEKLMLTQIIAGNALWDMGKFVHEIRRKWNIANYCSCNQSKSETSKKPAVNGLCKQLMSAVSKCFGPDVVNEQTNGSNDSIKNAKLAKVNNLNGAMDYIKQEGVAGYNPENSSPLSWLADVALNSSVKLESNTQKDKENHKDAGDSKDSARHSPNYSSDTDDGKNSENYSTLRELLIRPTSKNTNGNKNSSISSCNKKKMSTLDEVISHVIEQSVNNMDKSERTGKDGMKLLHYTKRFPQPKHGREPLPIRVFTLEESKVLYPDVPHSWLCNGRLLRLVDPDHVGNLKLFQEQWKRGQPVLVSEINKRLDINLWHPDSFSRDYGDKKNDLVNCSTGAIVPNQPMRKFWEGFETYAKRMKDENGEYMLLKLKDWPPGDDFSEMLPSRFEDLMKALPLPEYTHRNGLLNIAGRLPECFVRPDLGPKMYNAYGSAMHPDKGTTNLHLDISDAVNVMVYVGIPKDSDSMEHMQEALRAIEEGGCDTITLRRVREKGSKPGALWHIYNARDADKIRDLLNKVAIEKGETLEPHHDPIHDQSWYLDGYLRERLYKEYGVEGYAIAQCLGDAVFIPAGAPHQVRNLHSCIKVAEDFVSPENISHCFTLTQEFRDLSDTHTNHEDKLQVKNIIYHAVRDALALLMTNDPANFKDLIKSN